jgi:hypothetical protein
MGAVGKRVGPTLQFGRNRRYEERPILQYAAFVSHQPICILKLISNRYGRPILFQRRFFY